MSTLRRSSRGLDLPTTLDMGTREAAHRTPGCTPYDEAISPSMTAALAALFGGVLVVQLLTYPAPLRYLLAAMSLVTGLALVALTLWIRRALATGSRPTQRHLVACTAVLLVTINAYAYLLLSQRALQSIAILLAIVGAGTSMTSARCLVWMLGGIWAGWLACVLAIGEPVDALAAGAFATWTHVGLGLVAATMLAWWVHTTRKRSVEALAVARDAARAISVCDDLTGLTNRRGLQMLGNQVVEAARRAGGSVHCTFVDVDGLKKVNDQLGHDAGDDVLLAVAEALRANTRAADVVARWGGDEFAVVGPGSGMPPGELARRVRSHLIEGPPVPLEYWPCRVSAGGAHLQPWDEGDLTTLLRSADQDMYLRRALRLPSIPEPPVRRTVE